jgi:hypothetical protein
MTEYERARRDAVKCLRMAKSAQNLEDKQSWLALAESWLSTVQLQSTSENFHVTEEIKIQALEWASHRPSDSLAEAAKG